MLAVSTNKRRTSGAVVWLVIATVLIFALGGCAAAPERGEGRPIETAADAASPEPVKTPDERRRRPRFGGEAPMPVEEPRSGSEYWTIYSKPIPFEGEFNAAVRRRFTVKTGRSTRGNFGVFVRDLRCDRGAYAQLGLDPATAYVAAASYYTSRAAIRAIQQVESRIKVRSARVTIIC